MLLAILFIVVNLQVNTRIYRFEEGYVELWYQIPLKDIVPLTESNSFLREFSYRLEITSKREKESTIREGNKVIVHDAGDCVYEYFPLWLYPDSFSYQLVISTAMEREIVSGDFAALIDTATFYASDVMLGLKKIEGESFSRRGIKFTPFLLPQFSNYDTIFSYIEVYGLVPDSLFYKIHYQIRDSLFQKVYEKFFQRPKFDYSQYDTHSIVLSALSSGDYLLSVEVFEPALNMTVRRECPFKVKELLPDITNERFAWEIKYLVADKEYKKFCNMDYNEQVKYLKKFWAKRNYKDFERRLLEADLLFSVSNLKGRDTPQGKFYILKGPPDEIKKYGIEQELWIYEREGLEVLFRDTDGDGVYELMGMAKIGAQEFQENLKDRKELWKYLYRCD